ncbi:MAG: site-specific integrase [Lachnospiraceae bacterium]|nr:site-specific integrase [Lachnospiraceae bacterium]
MAKSRRDNMGHALKRGEFQRSQDGRYAYSYTDPLGQRRTVYANNLRELRIKEDELTKNQLDGLDLYTAEKTTLDMLFDRYIKAKRNLRETTRTNYIYNYDRYVRNGFGKKRICDIKYSDVLFFYQSLIDERGLSVHTVDGVHGLLHPAFEMAVRDDIIRRNPTDNVMAELKKKIGKNKGVRHALTVEQQKAFLNYIADSDTYSHWYSLFTFLLGTGCRIGEAIGIRWKDVDFEKRVISVNHSVSYFAEKVNGVSKCGYRVFLPKTDSGIRQIPMLDEVYETLKVEYEYQKSNGFNKIEVDGMNGFIFANRFGSLYNGQSVNRAIKRICEAYNSEIIEKAKKAHNEPLLLPDFSAHHLRHTFATRLCENVSNLKVIQSVMGHASIETTMDIYAEATEGKKQEVFKELNIMGGII